LWRAAKARVLAGQGDFEEALRLADESLALLGPRRVFDSALMLVNAADVYRAAGNVDVSRQFLAEAVEMREKKDVVIGDEWMQELLAQT
jgi:ATP/maltotriose-dependent transcriptional regulator MalT